MTLNNAKKYYNLMAIIIVRAILDQNQIRGINILQQKNYRNKIKLNIYRAIIIATIKIIFSEKDF